MQITCINYGATHVFTRFSALRCVVLGTNCIRFRMFYFCFCCNNCGNRINDLWKSWLKYISTILFIRIKCIVWRARDNSNCHSSALETRCGAIGKCDDNMKPRIQIAKKNWFDWAAIALIGCGIWFSCDRFNGYDKTNNELIILSMQMFPFNSILSYTAHSITSHWKKATLADSLTSRKLTRNIGEIDNRRFISNQFNRYFFVFHHYV